MNASSKILGGLDRWFAAVPAFLTVRILAVILAALVIITGAGQAWLQAAGKQLEHSMTCQLRIDELELAISQAVNAQRTFLLTGDQSYASRYEKDSAEIEPRLERLRLAYVDREDGGADMRNLQILIGKRLADLGIVLDIQQKEGTPAAVALIATSVGSDAGLAIKDILAKMRSRAAEQQARANRRWDDSLNLTRWAGAAGALVSILLVVFAASMTFRARELSELSTHLQNLAEREKASLAREMHDELGGLLVGARMDLSWAEKHLAKDDPDLKQRLNRVQQSLSSGVDLKRRIIEELRPTLLDNVGLFAALRWQFKQTCGNAGLICTESYPDDEPRFISIAAISLFRIAQEAFDNILKHASARSASFSLEFDDSLLQMLIADDGVGLSSGASTAIGSHGLASIRHRARALGGRVDVRRGDAGGTLLTVRIPMSNAALPMQVIP